MVMMSAFLLTARLEVVKHTQWEPKWRNKLHQRIQESFQELSIKFSTR